MNVPGGFAHCAGLSTLTCHPTLTFSWLIRILLPSHQPSRLTSARALQLTPACPSSSELWSLTYCLPHSSGSAHALHASVDVHSVLIIDSLKGKVHHGYVSLHLAQFLVQGKYSTND